jgi:hypothetical protein
VRKSKVSGVCVVGGGGGFVSGSVNSYEQKEEQGEGVIIRLTILGRFRFCPRHSRKLHSTRSPPGSQSSPWIRDRSSRERKKNQR